MCESFNRSRNIYILEEVCFGITYFTNCVLHGGEFFSVPFLTVDSSDVGWLHSYDQWGA